MNLQQERILNLLKAQQGLVVEVSEDDVISVSNDEGIDAFIVIGDSQIVVESVLFPASAVQDTIALNELILETHRLVPLTTVGKSTIAEASYYVVFGALSVGSKDEVILEEVETLFANVPEFLELYSGLLK